MSQNLEKLKRLLAELFQFDQADLDFGIYRIMNAKRDEISRFLDRDLLPQVREAFAAYEAGNRGAVEAELANAIQNAKDLGFDPEASPTVKEIRARLAQATDVTALENEVYSHLFNFFRRYYDEGDFISLRRYKEGVYAIPYEGEEVKLHWANRDQYYIKTSENFRNYTFRLPSGKRVHFKLAQADTERENNQAQNGKNRRFILWEQEPLAEQDGELVIRFEYRPQTKPAKQADLNAAAVERILTQITGFDEWRRELTVLSGTEKNPSRTLLEKHLADYTARNTFDYFIHKDLSGFLRRELDFYIKNEVMHLDDVESETAPRVEQYLSKIKAIRRIAHKLIDFLAQIEDFQKRLWLKKKFVVETQYCMTLDRVPEVLYAEIAANEAQHQEWIRLFAIDEIQADLINPGYSSPLTVEFLKANQNLLVDTRFFDAEFKRTLLAAVEDLDASADGMLVHSDNFQALRLLNARYRDKSKCIYIDPPYNTDSSSIPYKNDYKHSSFATLMYDRLAELRRLLRPDGAIFVSIDKAERTVVEHMLDEIFGPDNHIEELIWTQNTANSQLPNYSTNHEYVEVYARDRSAVEADADMFREPKPGYAEIVAILEDLNPQYPAPKVVEAAIKKLFREHLDSFRDEIEASGREWDAETQKQDPWKGIYNYCNVEYRDSTGCFVQPEEARARSARLSVWREISPSAPAGKQSPTTKDPDHHNYRYYKPLHPLTGRPCPHPKGGWKFPLNPEPGNPSRRSFVELDRDKRIVWGDDETKVPQTKGFLHEVETNIGTSVFYEYNDGESEVAGMFGRSGLFLSPKSSRFVRRFVAQTTRKSDLVIDAFGGSGSTAHAVLSLNSDDQANRRYVLIEVGDHFVDLLKPRVLKAAYSKGWREGRPSDRKGQSHCLKYIRLESYEDTLNNLELKRSGAQQSLLDQHADLREDYMLRYMLDVESRGSASLLNVERFDDPFNYQLNISTGTAGETAPTVVDLVETFNYLLGLRVKTMDEVRGVRVVTGLNPAGERVLVLWRRVKEIDNDALDSWFRKQGYNTRDQEFDVIYVNGDNNLENLRKDEQTWKVRLIEQEFQRLMFDDEGI